MATQNSVWTVISCDAITNRVRSLLDRGFFAEAEQISKAIKAFMAKVSTEAEAKGGHLYVTLYERIVMEIPITFAEELPNIIEGFKDLVGNNVAAGLGMTFDEATAAAQKSVATGQIELYDPDQTEPNQPYYKNDDGSYELPPNLFDQVNPPSPDPQPKKPVKQYPKTAMRAAIDQEMQLETKYVQAVAQTMGAPSPEEIQQQMQAQQQAQGQMEGLPPELQAALQAQQEGNGKEGSKEKSKGSKGSSDSDDSEESSQDSDDDDSETNDKLANLLITAKEHIPDIMKLKEKDPKAFDQAMKLIQKLADLTRSRKKTAKSEQASEIEELNKAFNAAVGRGWPVGTRKGRKKKVIVDGKAVWRSMASGQIQDSKGQPISVKSHNAAAQAGKQTEQ